jgi:hypothetical protein
VRLAIDGAGQRALLFPGEWHLQYFQENNPGVRIGALPFPAASPAAAAGRASAAAE